MIDSKKCPFCGESIKANAKKCRYCPEFLDGLTREQIVSDVNSGGGAYVAGNASINGGDFIARDKITIDAFGDKRDRDYAAMVAVKKAGITDPEKLIFVGYDLSGRNLAEFPLARARISNANLSGTNLTEADLSSSDLSHSTLSGANLNRANLTDAKLRGVNLITVDLSGTELTHINLRNSILCEQNLFGQDLSNADLSGADLSGVNLSEANLSEANLSDVSLNGADLSGANLKGANLTSANLSYTNLSYTNLSGTNLSGADLRRADLSCVKLGGANLLNVDLSHALVIKTEFVNVDLSGVWGLETVQHLGPSVIDINTIVKSKGQIPAIFLHGCGVPYDFIKDINALINTPTRFYSCFISYSHADAAFAQRLHDTLQGKGVRCWLDERDARLGVPITHNIESGIRLTDKFLLCCSKESLSSEWVNFEIDLALHREMEVRQADPNDLWRIIPLDLDGHLFSQEYTGEATRIRNRLAGDFTGWKTDSDKFNRQIAKVMQAIRIEGEGSITK